MTNVEQGISKYEVKKSNATFSVTGHVAHDIQFYLHFVIRNSLFDIGHSLLPPLMERNVVCYNHCPR